MRGEDFSATLDRFAICVAGVTCFQSAGEDLHNFLPGAGFDSCVDATVGEDFDTALKERNENQYARVIAGVVQPVLRERSECESVNGVGDSILRGDQPLDLRNSAENKSY